MPAKNRSLAAFCALSLGILACGSQVDSGGSSAEPRPTQITPNSGYVGEPTQVVIAGTGFLVKTVQGAGGGSPTIYTTHRAWFGDAVPANELQNVTWVNDAVICGAATPPCLTATVPAGLTPGIQALTVENALGLRGRLENAFTLVSTPLGALSAAIASDRSTVSVGQIVTLTLTVTNTGGGSANITTVDPSTTPPSGSTASATCGAVTSSAASPAVPQTIASHTSVTFIWTCTPATGGALLLSASVTGADTFTSLPLSATPPTAAAITIQTPPALTAALFGPGSVAFGTFFNVIMTVTNTGEAAAVNVTPTSLTVSGTGQAAMISGPNPISSTVPGAAGATAGSASFSWTFQAGSSPGTLIFSGGAGGVDTNSGATITAPPASSNQATVAPLGAALELTPSASSVSVNQTFTLTLTVTNGGSAAVDNLTPGPLNLNPSIGGAATYVNGPTPPSVASLPGCSAAPCPSLTFAWTYTATAPGQLSPIVTVSGFDHVSHQPVSAASNVLPITVQTAAALTGTLSAPSPVSTGQSFPLTLTFTKGGTAPANVTAVTNPSGCVNPTPATRSNVLSGQTITWTCTAPVSAQTISLGTTVSWVDANNPGAILTLGPTAADVTVQSAAAVTATSITAPATVNTGQIFALTLNLTKTGTAGANVTAIELNAAAASICSGQNPATPVLNVGAAQSFTWTCTAPGTAQNLSLNATATWVDVNVGTPQTATSASAANVAVQTQSLLSVSAFTASPTAVTVNQPVTVNITVANAAGSAVANNVAVALVPSGVASVTCTVSGSPPTTIAAGSTGSFAWTCTPAAAGTLSFSASVTWNDANSGAALGPVYANASNSVTVTNIAIDPASASVSPRGGQVFTVSGGLGPYTWSVPTHPSGSPAIVASGSNNSTGTYTAGSTGSVTDVVQVADSLGNIATANISVTAGVSVSPPAPSVAPGDSVNFIASGGSGSGYAWTMIINNSGGSIDSSSGAYVAGLTSSTADVVQVADSLGNTATACVSVGGGGCP